MKKLLVSLSLLILFQGVSFAQQQFIAKGKIEFERKINVHKQWEGDNEFIQEMKKNIPQYTTAYFDFYFNEEKSIYKPGRESADLSRPNNWWVQGPARENIVFTDYASQTSVSQKQVFESLYLVSDSMRRMNWKFTSDMRKIAGFNCRKATGIIMDSVFVFAFYTDEIMVSGGPEGFSGLPGMILGIAIPRIHTTWFATKVELAEPTTKDMAAPTKGRKTNIPELEKSLQSSLKDWGKWAQRNIWWIML